MRTGEKGIGSPRPSAVAGCGAAGSGHGGAGGVGPPDGRAALPGVSWNVRGRSAASGRGSGRGVAGPCGVVRGGFQGWGAGRSDWLGAGTAGARAAARPVRPSAPGARVPLGLGGAALAGERAAHPLRRRRRRARPGRSGLRRRPPPSGGHPGHRRKVRPAQPPGRRAPSTRPTGGSGSGPAPSSPSTAGPKSSR